MLSIGKNISPMPTEYRAINTTVLSKVFAAIALAKEMANLADLCLCLFV